MNHGVLCDVLVLHPDKEDQSNSQSVSGTARYYYELPGEWAEENMLSKWDHAWVIIFKDHRNRLAYKCSSLNQRILIPVLDYQVITSYFHFFLPLSAFQIPTEPSLVSRSPLIYRLTISRVQPSSSQLSHVTTEVSYRRSGH